MPIVFTTSSLLHYQQRVKKMYIYLQYKVFVKLTLVQVQGSLFSQKLKQYHSKCVNFTVIVRWPVCSKQIRNFVKIGADQEPFDWYMKNTFYMQMYLARVCIWRYLCGKRQVNEFFYINDLAFHPLLVCLFLEIYASRDFFFVC